MTGEYSSTLTNGDETTTSTFEMIDPTPPNYGKSIVSELDRNLRNFFLAAFNNDNAISKKLVLFEKFGKDKIFLYASILGLGEMVGSGFLFTTAFRKKKLINKFKTKGFIFLSGDVN